MSLVSVVLKDTHITIMTDGRVVDSKMQPINENYKKFKVISPNQFIGFAGNKDYCLFIAEQIKYIDTIYDLNLISREIFDYSNSNANDLKWNFVLGGIDTDGLISAYYLNRKSEKVDYFKPKGDELNYLFLHNSENISDNKINGYLEKFLKRRISNSVFEFYDAQRRFNNYVSGIDTAVNTITFRHRVRKS